MATRSTTARNPKRSTPSAAGPATIEMPGLVTDRRPFELFRTMTENQLQSTRNMLRGLEKMRTTQASMWRQIEDDLEHAAGTAHEARGPEDFIALNGKLLELTSRHLMQEMLQLVDLMRDTQMSMLMQSQQEFGALAQQLASAGMPGGTTDASRRDAAAGSGVDDLVARTTAFWQSLLGPLAPKPAAHS